MFDGEHELTFGPSRVVVVLLVASTAVAAVAAFTQPVEGRLLFGALALLTGVEAARALLLGPMLTANASGVSFVRGAKRVRAPWSRVVGIGEFDSRGARRRANAVEIDLEDTIAVIPAYRLGAPVEDVVSALARLRAAAAHRPEA